MKVICEMSANVKRHMALLEFLKVAPPKICKIILENADNNLVLAICEICLNFCQGNIKCHRQCYNKLKKFKRPIYKLANTKKKKTHFKQERNILSQNGGGFLPLLLAPALYGLTEYFISNKNIF